VALDFAVTMDSRSVCARELGKVGSRARRREVHGARDGLRAQPRVSLDEGLDTLMAVAAEATRHSWGLHALRRINVL